MRHMIDSQNQDLRPHFLGFIDQLLDDNALLGTSRTSYETLRPLAYSTLADLIHHVRSKLDLPQITKTVTFYTRIMYDPTLALSIQTMSAKLLVHLVESIFKLHGNQQVKEAGRHILVNIMAAFVNKIKSLSKMISRLGDQKKSESQENKEDSATTEKKDEKKEVSKDESIEYNPILDEGKKDPLDSDKGYKCKIIISNL
jgi:transformation/transcription domain-associated protein